MLVDAGGVFHQPVAPLRGEQIGLLEKIEELVLRPFRIGEALVLRIGRDHRLGLFAGHAFDRAGPQIEIGAAEAGLQFERALGIGQPVFRHLADGLDHVGDVFGQLAFDFAFLARLHIGGERLAAFLDQAGEIVREASTSTEPSLRRRFWHRFLRRFLRRSWAGFSRFAAGLFHPCHVGPRLRNGPDRVLPQGAICKHGFAGVRGITYLAAAIIAG